MRILASLMVAALLTTPALAANRTVIIDHHAFSPASLTIAAGDSVTFINQEGAPHTATAQGVFDTGRLNRGEGRKLTFKSKGTFAYICTVHPNMHGSITVK